VNNQTKFQTYADIIINDIDRQISILGTIYQNSDQNFEESMNQLMEIISKNMDVGDVSENEYIEIMQYLQGADTFSQTAKDTLSQYSIVAVYSLYEKGLKRILKLAGFPNEFIDQKAVNTDELSAKLVEQGITADFPTDFHSINELRLLNNCIKHNGTVSKKLSENNNNWQEGQLLNNVYDDFIRLKSVPINFLRNLISKISEVL
jgi:hypothetical protein